MTRDIMTRDVMTRDIMECHERHPCQEGTRPVPTYDIRCRVCDTTFEIVRPMARADEPAACPQGHDDTRRLLPTIAVTGLASAAPAPSGCGTQGVGGCCGGGCAS